MEEKEMEENILPKGFFKKNPLKKISAAVLIDYRVKTEMIDELHGAIENVVDASMTDDRRVQLEQAKQEIAAITSGEDIERYMRKNPEVLANPLLYKKALSLIEDAAPYIIKRYKTTAQDKFIECAFCILVHADTRYTEELFAAYQDIRNPYAQATVCLLLGEHDIKSSASFLLKEYKRFQMDYPNERFEQFPLLALYLLFGKA